MATRATYEFVDKDGTFSYFVYKHWCGEPRLALQFIKNAMKLAWPLPRFEADEFGAAFVAANKGVAGDVRLMNRWGDVGQEYHYAVSFAENNLFVDVYKVIDGVKVYQDAISGPIEAAIAAVKKLDKISEDKTAV